MIINRTDEDVKSAKIIRSNIQIGIMPTQEQIEILERGTYTINTLNRVEKKQKELQEKLQSYGYMVGIINKTDWTNSDIFTYQDHERILNNLDKLKRAFFVFVATPKTPKYMFGWQSANNIEKILVDIEEELSMMINYFRKCGTFECGEENV